MIPCLDKFWRNCLIKLATGSNTANPVISGWEFIANCPLIRRICPFKSRFTSTKLGLSASVVTELFSIFHRYASVGSVHFNFNGFPIVWGEKVNTVAFSLRIKLLIGAP